MPGTGTSSTTHVSSEVVSKLLAQKDMQSRKEMESIREESAKLRGENEALRELYQSLRDDLGKYCILITLTVTNMYM